MSEEIRNNHPQQTAAMADSKGSYEAPQVVSHRISQIVQGSGSKDPDGGPNLPGLVGPP
jgi:hypothetical protein